MADERIIRDFPTVMKLPGGGKFAARVDEKLALMFETLSGLSDQGAKATLTLTFNFNQTDDRIGILASVKLKLPEEKGFPEYPTFAVEGGISLQHPSQFELNLKPRVVSGA